MASTGEAWRLGRRPALDGLRGIAVLLVVFSHAFGFSAFGAGQVGVSMFFTLSGFLIASLLLEEHATTGRVDFRAFYVRRARRLLPALLACLTVCSLTAVVVGDWFVRPREVVAALFYATNWLSIVTGDPHGAISHMWSLAVEEQFYLAWPALFAVLAGRRRGLEWLAAIAVAGVALSFVLRMSLVSEGLWRVAFGSDTRADEVLAGVLLALIVRRRNRVADWSWATPIGVGVCLAVTIAPVHWVLGPGLLVAPVATCLVILGCVGRCESGWLQGRAFVWLGKRSYGIYLWHHPVAFLFGQVMMSPAERLVIIAISGFLMAEVSWRCVESPFLVHRVRSHRRAALPEPVTTS